MNRNFYSKSGKVKIGYELGKDYSTLRMNDVETQLDLPTGFKTWNMPKQKDFIESFADDIDDISSYLPKLALGSVNKIILDWDKLSGDLFNAGAIDAYDPATGEIANLSSNPQSKYKYTYLEQYFNKYTKRSTLLHELFHAIDLNKSQPKARSEMKASMVESRYLNDILKRGGLSEKDMSDVQFGLKASMDYLNFWKQKAVE